MASVSRVSITCWICERSVLLESCVVDEHGMAVHEDCSVAKIESHAKASTPQRKRLPRSQPSPSSN